MAASRRLPAHAKSAEFIRQKSSPSHADTKSASGWAAQAETELQRRA